jgi:transposase
MDSVYERCCGLDVHKDSVVACCIVPGTDGVPQKEVRSFGTMTDELRRLAMWLEAAGVTHVAMESTGVYWKPVWNLLEEGPFELILANPRQVKPNSRRKSDRKDSAWLADLLRHDLVRPSFVPTREQRELRELTRYRISLVQEHSAEVNRLAKTLEGANIKLGSVVSDLQGKSAREMLEHLVGGETDTALLADLARGRMRSKLGDLKRALEGRFGAHQRFLLSQQLAHLDSLEETIAHVIGEIEARMQSHTLEADCLDSIPGVGLNTAYEIIAEIGLDMTKFGDSARLASWAKLCPGINESAGKRHSGSTGKGDRWLRSTLIQTAHSLGRGKGYLASQYHSLAARRGKKKAAVAVAHSILVIAFHLLSNPGTRYEDLGANYLDERRKKHLTQRLVRRLQNLGFYVNLEPATA